MDVSNAMFIDFYQIYDLAHSILTSIGIVASAAWMSYLVACVAISFIIINVLIMSTAVYTWFERRVIGRFQVRRGPNRHGPFGILQPIADVVKLILKEDTIPGEAD